MTRPFADPMQHKIGGPGIATCAAALALTIIFFLPANLEGQLLTDEEIQVYCQQNDATQCTDLMRQQMRMRALVGIGPVLVMAGSNVPLLPPDSVEAQVRERLAASGMELLPAESSGSMNVIFMDTGLQTFEVEIHTSPLGNEVLELSVTVAFSEVAAVRRTGIQTRAETWQDSFRSPLPDGVTMSALASQLMGVLVDRFVEDFIAANPRGRVR